MKKFCALLLLIIVTSNIFSQSCKITTSNGSFYEDFDKAMCKEYKSLFSISWSGDNSSNLCDGYGTLTAYSTVTKELIFKEIVTFKKGIRDGFSTYEQYEPAIIKTTNKFFRDGKTDGLVVTDLQNRYNRNMISKCIFKLNNEQFDRNREIKYSVWGGTEIWNYIGLYDEETEILNGSLFIGNTLYQKGEFSFPVGISPLYGHRSYITFKSGTTYFQNGLSLFCSKYNLNGAPIACATLYYPNGDSIWACNFNWEKGDLSGWGKYYWANGSYYAGSFENGVITKRGHFFDGKGNSNYGDFPQYSKAKNGDDLLLGIATVGLVAWGISELFPASPTKTTTAPAKTEYSGSYSTYSKPSSSSYSSSSSSNSSSSNASKTYEIPKCYKCSGRGVCLECNGRGSSLCTKCDGKGVTGGLDIFLTSYKDQCTKCEGTGIKKCNECSGKGTCYKCKGKGTAY